MNVLHLNWSHSEQRRAKWSQVLPFSVVRKHLYKVTEALSLEDRLKERYFINHFIFLRLSMNLCDVKLPHPASG